MVLLVNACVRRDSRTRQLAETLLEKLAEDYEEIQLEEADFPKADEEFLNNRDRLIENRSFGDASFAMARQFAAADTIVIAAPYWDLSFPAMLKQYFEQINVLGITFEYTKEGIPRGLCKAGKIYYVMTAGGDFAPEEFGFGYVRALAQNYYGIREAELIRAVGLDLDGADAEAILKQAADEIRNR